MKKSSIILALACGGILSTEAHAQSDLPSKKAPDALYYKSDKDLLKEFKAYRSDSAFARFFGNPDSVTVHSDGSISAYGTMPYDILLDNRSESDSYVLNGTRYYIRNAKPKMEAKKVKPGSNVYKLK